MKNILLLLLCFCSTVLFSFDLIRAGKPAAVILENKQVQPEIRFLNQSLKRCTGTELSISPVPVKGMNSIRFELKSMFWTEDDTFEFLFPQKNEMLIRGSKRSIRWALNHLLEEYAGIIPLMPGKSGTCYPKTDTIRIEEKTIRKQAAFNIYREHNLNEEEWGAFTNEKQWRSTSFFNHAMYRIFPLKKYAESPWREKIMPLRKGIRLKPRSLSRWQPCFSNPESVTEAIKNICEEHRKHPEIKTVSLAINDLDGFCECENCREANGGLKKARFMKGYPNWSNLFYSWCSKVIDGVLKQYPDLMFGCSAYCGVCDPPDFKIHPRLVPVLAIDLYAFTDPATRRKRMEFIQAWATNAQQIGFWEYGYGLPYYSLPRIYFDLQAEVMKLYHANKGKVFFVENHTLSSEGPKRYLYSKLMFDVNTDHRILLKKWYNACVGKKAAPYLEQYYRYFENFWTGQKIRQTDWFQPGNVYLPLGASGAYLYAWTTTDQKNVRKLMEQMLSTARKYGTPDQIARAEKLALYHDYYEAFSIRNGAGSTPISGKICSKADALMLIRNMPQLFESSRKLPGISEKLYQMEMADTFIQKAWHKKCVFQSLLIKQDQSFELIILLNKLLPYADEPEVIAELQKLAAMPGIRQSYQDAIHGFLNRKQKPNELHYLPLQQKQWDRSYSCQVEETTLPNGKKAVKLISKGGWVAAMIRTPVLPSSNYFMRVRIRVPAGAKSYPQTARLLMSVVREKDQLSMQGYTTEIKSLKPGKSVQLELAHYTPALSKFFFRETLLYIIFPSMPKGSSVILEEATLHNITK